jgi:prepilin-type N-terminal cleavage/methylation domain-containing protein
MAAATILVDDRPLNRCGAMALTICADAAGRPATLSDVLEYLPDDGDQSTLLDLESAALQLGLTTYAVKWRDTAGTPNGTFPAVLPVVNRFGNAHFVALLETRGEKLLIADFPSSPFWVKAGALREFHRWDGTALHVCNGRLALWRLRLSAMSSLQVVLLLSSIMIAGLTFAVPRFRRQRRRLNQDAARAGMTILELIIAMAIIAMVVALLAPAVQRVRESARRTECENNLRQIGIALNNSEGARGQYPGLNVPRPNPKPRAETALLSIPYQLLPFLDQQALFNKVDRNEDASGWNAEPPGSTFNAALLTEPVPVFMCSSDLGFAGSINYRACAGTSPFLHTTPTVPLPNSARAGFASGAPRLAQQIRDGLSHTIFFSEKSLGDQDPDRYTPSRDLILNVPGVFLLPDDAASACRLPLAAVTEHASFGGATWLFSCNGYTCYNHVLTPNSPTPDCTSEPTLNGTGAYTARSRHVGGVYALFGDGSSKFVGQSIDLAVWRALSTIDSGDVAETP